MGSRLATVVVLTIALIAMTASPSAAATVSVADLVDNGATYAGQEVTVVGELVGDYGFRRDGWMWTQINGDSYATAPIAEGGGLEGSNIGIGVRMPSELGRGLDPPGRYRTVGPLVEATGIWRYHDASRQGETFLDVTAIQIVESGRTLSEPPDWIAIAIGTVLAVIAGIVARMYVKKREE